jgi:NADH-quinone oxidoreductase subunit D
LGKRGDNLDRFLLRIKETFECFRVVSQVTAALHHYCAGTDVSLAGGAGQQLSTSLNVQFFNMLNIRSKFTGMEEVIQHFRYFSEGLVTNAKSFYSSVEAPKGELGVMLFSGNSTKPYRLKVRTPVSHNMHLIPSVCAGLVFGDFVMTFCSLDIVLGEIDR